MSASANRPDPAPERPHPASLFLHWLADFLICGACLALAMVVAMIVAVRNGESGGPSWAASAVAYALTAILAISRYRHARRHEPDLIGLVALPRARWWIWLAVAAGILVAVKALQDFVLLGAFHINPDAPDLVTQALPHDDVPALACAFAAVVVLGPFNEELLLRGLLLGRFGAHGYWRSGIVLSAVLFAALHFDRVHILELTAAGLLTGWLYYRTRSLWPAVLLHVLNNAISFIEAIGLGK